MDWRLFPLSRSWHRKSKCQNVKKQHSREAIEAVSAPQLTQLTLLTCLHSCRGQFVPRLLILEGCVCVWLPRERAAQKIRFFGVMSVCCHRRSAVKILEGGCQNCPKEALSVHYLCEDLLFECCVDLWMCVAN